MLVGSLFQVEGPMKDRQLWPCLALLEDCFNLKNKFLVPMLSLEAGLYIISIVKMRLNNSIAEKCGMRVISK